MVKIRLTRMGKRKMPFYRVVVMDQKKRRDGTYIESLGFYDPMNDPAVTKLDLDRALEWLVKGAQPTDSVRSIFRKHGVMEKLHAIKNAPLEKKAEE